MVGQRPTYRLLVPDGRAQHLRVSVQLRIGTGSCPASRTGLECGFMPELPAECGGSNKDMNEGSVLEVQDVTVRFGGLTALDAVSLAVPPRHVLGVIGPNGAGKTTLLNVLCGFIRPDAGEMLFGGPRPGIMPHPLGPPRAARAPHGD